MGQDRKKKAKQNANRFKQNKFTAKYGNYVPAGKFIPEESEANAEETEVSEAHIGSEQANVIDETSKTEEIKIDEITEIKEEEQKEPTLADDFEPAKTNSNVTVTGQGLRSFLDDEEDEPQKKPGIAEQLKRQRPVLSSELLSFLDEDEEKKEEKPAKDVEDPMADLKTTIRKDLKKKQPKSEGLSQEDRERFIAQMDNVLALEYEELTNRDKEILSSVSEPKQLTKEETQWIDNQVTQAKADEIAEQNNNEQVPQDLNRDKAMPLPNVKFEEEIAENDVKVEEPKQVNIEQEPIVQEQIPVAEQELHSSSDGGMDEPQENEQKISISEQLKRQRPVVSSKLQSWLDEDEDKEEEAPEQEVEDPMADLRAAILNDAKNPQPKSEGLSQEDREKYIALIDNVLALEHEEITDRERAILSSESTSMPLTKEETQWIDSQVSQAKKDALQENDLESVPQVKADLHDVFLPDVELDEDEVKTESKDQSIEHIRSKVLLYDDSTSQIDSPEPDRNVNNEQPVANPEEESLKPRIPDFYQKLGERMNSADITEQVTSDIKSIIKEAGITDDRRIAELADASYSFVKKQINRIYDKETVPETKMSKDAPTFFCKAYESLYGSDLSTQAQIIAAQRIANVMLENYSPVAFIEEGLEHYANDYVLNNRDVFKSQLEMLRLYNVDALMDEVDAARGIYPQIENEDTEFTKWLNGRIDSPAVFGSVYNELNDILYNAGFTQQDALAELVRFTQYYGSRTIFDSPHLDGDDPNMHDIAVQFFQDSYAMIERAELSPKNRIITAQKISDVLLKNYSPAGKEREAFAQYANNYVLGDATLLREQLEKLNVQDIDTLITDRDIVSASGTENRVPDMINGTWLRENPRGFMIDRQRNERAITNISNILVEAGITEDAAQSLDVGDILEDAYSVKNIPADSVSMRDVAKHVFVSTYKELNKKDLAPNNKIETAQKIADVILKNYSPIIRNKALGKYADHYVINDNDLLKESMAVLNARENEKIAGIDEKKPEVKPEVKLEVKAEVKAEPAKEGKTKEEQEKQLAESGKSSFFTGRLDTFSKMYRIDINANDFVFAVSESWRLMKSGNEQDKANGQKVMGDLFKNVLKSSFEVERNASYNEHRIPEFNEIIKSTNELFRSAMYAFTDLYHDPKSAALFDATAYGGLKANEMAELTTTDSLWKMDQKSDKAWDIQSSKAKDVAEQWKKENKPYEKMINEMNKLIEASKDGTLGKQEMYDKLTAAEWLLVNNEKMMLEDPKDPLNPIPNWGNRYWKAITDAREACGVPKHISMRDLIQGDYAESAKAVVSTKYNETQIMDYVLDPDVRKFEDSLEAQKEEFTTQSKDIVLKKPKNEKTINEHKNEIRWREPVESENERKNMKNEPKIFSNLVIEKQADLKIDSVREDFR